MNSIVDLFMPLREIAKLFADALEIVNGCCGLAIADGIDPKDPVVFREPEHDVFLAERIAVPVVTEANDVLTLNHTRREVQTKCQ